MFDKVRCKWGNEDNEVQPSFQGSGDLKFETRRRIGDRRKKNKSSGSDIIIIIIIQWWW
jgi:hypothetical protein